MVFDRSSTCGRMIRSRRTRSRARVRPDHSHMASAALTDRHRPTVSNYKLKLKKNGELPADA